MVKDKQTRDEVTAAINKLKAKEPSALVTVEDLEMINEMCTQPPDPTLDHDVEDQD